MIISRKHKGFTLIELLVVIAIIGVLSSSVLASLNTARKKARDARRLSDMKQIYMAMELYYDEHGTYPTDGPGSDDFIGVGSTIDDKLDEYIDPVPKDPLHDGSVYYYAYDSSHCTDKTACNCDGGGAAVFGFNKSETNPDWLRKDVCSGGDANLDDADYNIKLYPASSEPNAS